MKEHVDGTQHTLGPNIYGTSRPEILAGLARVAQKAPADSWVRRVNAALERLGDRQVFARETDDLLYRFIAVTAAVGAWDKLAAFDERRAAVLLAYCTEPEKRQEDLVALASTNEVPVNQSRVSQLLAHSIHFLHKQLPDHLSSDFPLDKDTAFPLPDLQSIGTSKYSQRQRVRLADPMVLAKAQENMLRAREKSWATWPKAEETA